MDWRSSFDRKLAKSRLTAWARISFERVDGSGGGFGWESSWPGIVEGLCVVGFVFVAINVLDFVEKFQTRYKYREGASDVTQWKE